LVLESIHIKPLIPRLAPHEFLSRHAPLEPLQPTSWAAWLVDVFFLVVLNTPPVFAWNAASACT